MGVAMFPPCCLTWGQTMVEVMKIMLTSFKRSHARTSALSAPNPAAGYRWPMPLRETPGYSWASLSGSVSCGVTAPFFWVLVHRGSVSVLPESVSLALCKFWQLYGGLMATSSKRAYAIPRSTAPRAPAPSSPLLTHTSTEDNQTQFCLSLCGVLGPGVDKVFFEPSERLWWVWGLILKAISPFLPSCWGFSFAPGRGLSPHSCSRATQLPLQCHTAAYMVSYSLFNGEGNGTPLQYSCLENPMDGGAW